MEPRHEEYLRTQAGKGQEMVLQMVRSLSSALVYPEAGNVATNEKLWDVYASEWSNGDWVAEMASGNRQAAGLEPEGLDCVGEEWAPKAHTQQVFDEWLAPLLSNAASVAEVGSGGGRIAKLVTTTAPSTKLHCFDVSEKMLAKAKKYLPDDVEFTHIHGDAERGDEGFSDVKPRAYPTRVKGAFDVVYCFDVMVHMDLHAMYACLKRLRSLVKEEDGAVFISTSNLQAPHGWARFERQSKFTVGGFFFVTPDAVRTLCAKAGFDVVRESETPATASNSNVYYDRDFLLVLKPQPASS